MALVKGIVNEQIVHINDYIDGNVLCCYCGTHLTKEKCGDLCYFAHKKYRVCDKWSERRGESLLHILWKSVCKIDGIEHIIDKRSVRHIIDLYSPCKNLAINIIDCQTSKTTIKHRTMFCSYDKFGMKSVLIVWVIDLKEDEYIYFAMDDPKCLNLIRSCISNTKKKVKEL